MKSLKEIAQALKTKKVSSIELIHEAIKAVEQYNPSINAVARLHESYALKIAQQDFSNTTYGGIPIFLKDLGQNVAGLVNTSGSKLFKQATAQQTDYFVQQLMQLGFIVLGQTTTPEFGFKNYTQSDLFGTTKNGLNQHYHAGGSSGGSAAAISSGMIAIAGASDGGGSIRIPASWNGLIGLKPSRGSMKVGPGSYRNWQGASSHFVLTKQIDDVSDLFFKLQTAQIESPFPLPLQKLVMIRPLKIGFSIQSPVGTPVTDEAVEGVLSVVALLEKLGHSVKQVPLPIDGKQLIQQYYQMNSVETAAMFKRLQTVLNCELTLDDMEMQTWLIYETGKHIDAATYSMILSHWDQSSAKMFDFHQEFDVFIEPATNGSAPLLTQYGVETEKLNRHLICLENYTQKQKEEAVADAFYTGLVHTPFNFIYNLTGQPAISLPLHTTKNGMPMGIQFVAAKGQDALLLAIAKQLEPYYHQYA